MPHYKGGSDNQQLIFELTCAGSEGSARHPGLLLPATGTGRGEAGRGRGYRELCGKRAVNVAFINNRVWFMANETTQQINKKDFPIGPSRKWSVGVSHDVRFEFEFDLGFTWSQCPGSGRWWTPSSDCSSWNHSGLIFALSLTRASWMRRPGGGTASLAWWVGSTSRCSHPRCLLSSLSRSGTARLTSDCGAPATVTRSAARWCSARPASATTSTTGRCQQHCHQH